MKQLQEWLTVWAVLIAWIAGTVLAAGWLKAVAALFPPYALYLVVERAMQAMGV